MWDGDAFRAQAQELGFEEHLAPAFRLTAYVRYETGHPYLLTEQWQALFDLFRPILKMRCDKLKLWPEPGGKPRRGLKIKPDDWQPFDVLKSVHDDVEDGIFIAFRFLAKENSDYGDGPAATSFRFYVGSVIMVDACIELEDWSTNKLNVPSLIAALQQLPYLSVIAGYGLRMSSRFDTGDAGDYFGNLRPLAARYPVLDMGYEDSRSYFPGDLSEVHEIGVAGINWLTGIGEPFRAKAGSGLTLDLPSGLRADVGPHGTLFQIGDGPITGEAGVSDMQLPLYHELGTRIAQAWAPNEDMHRSPVFGEMLEDESLAWERRLYQPFLG